jgi:hypothetical protein
MPVQDLYELVYPACFELMHDTRTDGDIGYSGLSVRGYSWENPHGKGQVFHAYVFKKLVLAGHYSFLLVSIK